MTDMTYGYNVKNNKLFGPVPTQLGNFAIVDYFQLSTNKLSGTVPTEVKCACMSVHL